MTLQAVIFDLDGTLAETEEVHREAFNQAFRDFGLDWTWDRPLYKGLLRTAGGRERIRVFVADHDPARLDAADFDDFVKRLHLHKTDLYTRRIHNREVALRPGVARLIAELRAQGTPVAIATTTSAVNVDALLLATLGPDSPGWFAAISPGDHVPNKKPAPDLYNLALERLGLPPSACLAVEDANIGVASARAAGLPVLVTESAYTAGGAFEGACAVLSDLGEPDAPFKLIRGDAFGASHVTPETLRQWHAAGNQS